MNKIIIACDHAGFQLKNKLIEYLTQKGYEVEDNGCYNEESVDYPVIAKNTAEKVAQKTFEKGILICGSGVGMCITANKTKGIRAVVCSDTTTAKFSRMHNDTNILCLGQRIIGEYLAKDICDIWLSTKFEAQRHLNRINQIES